MKGVFKRGFSKNASSLLELFLTSTVVFFMVFFILSNISLAEVPLDIPQAELDIESLDDIPETVKGTELPIYVHIDRDIQEITIINRNDVPVDLYILALDEEGFEIASWPLPAFSDPIGLRLKIADIFWGIPADQIASIKVVSDEPIKVIENYANSFFATKYSKSVAIILARDISTPLNVPFLSQRNDSWGCTQLGATSSICSGYSKCGGLDSGIYTKPFLTIWNYGCFLTSKTMVFNYFRPSYYNPSSLNSCLISHVGYDSGCLMKFDNTCVPPVTTGIAVNKIYSSLNSTLATLSPIIDQYLGMGYPILADVRYNTTESCETKVSQHMVVIVAKNGSTYTIKDPWDGTESFRTLNNGALGLGAYKLCRIHVYEGPVPGTSCSDFGEPNGSFSSAYALSCGSTASAKICSSSDVDYYKVTPSASGTMTIRLTPPSDKDYDLYIYNSSQAQVCSSTLGTGVQDVCNVTVTGGQTYYIRVIGYSGAYSTTSNYSLGISCPSATLPGAVSANPTSGNWTSSPQNVSVSSSNATQIFYTIRTTLDGTTPVDPPEPTSTLNDGSISGSSGTFQVYASAGQNKKLKVRFRGYNSAGYGTTSSSFLYTINLSSSTCSDFGEPNGSFSSAYALSCNTSLTAKVCSSSDIDYYKVTPSASGTMTIRLTPPSDKDYDLYIYNSSQTQVCSSTAGTGVQDVCNVTVTGGQTYYIRVIGYNGAYSTTSNYNLGISCPSATLPGAVSANPTSGNWTSSPQNVSVSSSNATQIFYTIRTTLDGTTPVDPPEPTSTLNDGSISGSSGTFQVYASAGQNKKLKVRFRGYNSTGYGTTSSSFLYTINLQGSSLPGSISVSPSSGSWTSSPQNLSVSSSNATTIYYTMVNTYDGSTPADPSTPTPSSNNGSISGPSGTFQLYASAGQYKKSKLRFVGCNSVGCGSVSGVYSYTIDLRTVPGTGYASVSSGVNVSPSPVVLGQNFTISFTLKERLGASKTFENIAIAILDPSNTFIFDFAMFPSVTIPAYGTKSYSAQNYIYTSRPTGTYKAVVRGKVGGQWFDFDTVDSGVNPKSFSVVR